MMINNETCITVADLLVLVNNNKLQLLYMFNIRFFSEFLDGQKPKEELLAVVCEDVCQEIEKLRGMCVNVFLIHFMFSKIFLELPHNHSQIIY